MHDMVMDLQLGSRFVALLLVKLDAANRIESGVTVDQPNISPLVGSVMMESLN